MSGERRRDLWDDEPETTAPPEPDPTEPTTDEPRRHRHARRRPRPPWVLLLAGLLVLALGAGGAFAALRGTEEASACGGEALTVAATPEIAEPLEAALTEVEEADDCAAFEVTATSAAQAAEGINDGQAPDVWIPDSSTWIDAIDADQSPGQWLEGQSIASSPVVLASGSVMKGAPTTASSWTSLLNKQGSLRMADPDADTASRLAFHASRVGQPDRIGLQTGKRLIFMSRFAAPSVKTLFGDYVSDPAEGDPFPASEQQVARHNEEHPDTPALRAVLPEQGTLSLDYPWITNPELRGEALEAAGRARTELGTVAIRQALTDAGFRDAKGGGGPEVAGTKAPEVTELEAPARDERVEAVDQWDRMRTDMRMLAVIDASGSMEWDSPTPGRSRWDVTKGSLTEGVGIIPAGSQVGAWVFSSDRKGGEDHEEIAPVTRLDATAGSGTHRDRLRRLVSGGDRYLGGDTGLYDSIWAAHQKMVDEYDPDYVNSIVVFTDGENDDPNGGLSLDQLLTRLDESYDAKRPVRIITIGMGEADPTALQQISDETGGSSYIAETPEDIERVFVGALLARGRS